MTEQDADGQKGNAGAPTGETHQDGHVTGLGGKRLHVDGVLDLRKVPASVVSTIESMHVDGVVLLDEGNRNALAGVSAQIDGTVLVVDPGLGLIIEPEIVLSKATVEAMPDAQQIMLVGSVFFKPDVRPELVAQKFERLHLIGLLIAREDIYGALLGRMERTGDSIVLPQDVGEVVRSMGRNTWTTGYLSRLPDGTTYVNIGVTSVAKDVSVELVERKIRYYHNMGRTEGSDDIMALLRSRCPGTVGKFLSREEN